MCGKKKDHILCNVLQLIGERFRRRRRGVGVLFYGGGLFFLSSSSSSSSFRRRRQRWRRWQRWAARRKASPCFRAPFLPPRSSSSLSSSFFSFSFPSRPTAAPFACFRGVFGSSSSSSCFSFSALLSVVLPEVFDPLFFVLLLFAFIRCSLNLFIFCCCASESWEKPETSDSRSSSSSSVSPSSRSSSSRSSAECVELLERISRITSATGDVADAPSASQMLFFCCRS